MREALNNLVSFNGITEYVRQLIQTKWELKTLFSSVINIPNYLMLNESI